MILASPNLIPRVQAAGAVRHDRSLTEVTVVCACDDQYAMPLNVMLHSAATTLSRGSRLTVYFIDGGLSESSWVALRETLTDLPIDVFSVRPDYSMVEHLHTSHHVTGSAYLRLLSAELLPDRVGRAIYLDSDLLIRSDLTELWEMETGNNYVLAAPDIACPFIDAKVGCNNWRRASPHLASLNPVPNYRELGLDPREMYFNSGVMVLNVDLWRQDQVAGQMLECLDNHRQHVWCWDQYALNVVFHKRWGRLPARWNQGAHAFEFESIANSPIEQHEFREMLHSPAIVHFTTEFKPWQHESMHRRGTEFFKALDQTSYRGWRPFASAFSWKSWRQRTGVCLARWFVTRWRRVSMIWTVRPR